MIFLRRGGGGWSSLEGGGIFLRGRGGSSLEEGRESLLGGDLLKGGKGCLLWGGRAFLRGEGGSSLEGEGGSS